MKTIGVIPARLASTRLPSKILAPILGKPMIQHVWERSLKSRMLDDLLIACDDKGVLEVCRQFKAKAVLTSQYHSSGSDRIAQAVKNLKVDVVVNIQGDEPLIHHSVIDDLVRTLKENPKSVMATTIKRIFDENELENPNVVKVVIDHEKNALYFSRAAIPFNRDPKKVKDLTFYKHLGIYAYRKDFLLKFTNYQKSDLENAEQLEQLRVLEAGYKIKTVITNLETISVDTREDLNRVEAYLREHRA